MKRHKNLAPLSREHHHILVLAQVLKANTPTYKGMPADTLGKVAYVHSNLHALLLPHMKQEEEKLFPHIRGYNDTIDALVNELSAEHREINILIQQLDTASDTVQALHEIGVKLATHVRKEERELFELVQDTIPEDVLATLRL